ncbi:MAG: GTP-binding protein [Candidatus Pacebacteria bacterium]|nr:GTP-binding protein [Candidatus Paceibacterota bacterium]
MNTTTQSETARPPVVAIMGHVDHGKSTLLDFIRNANVVAGEAGGITQHIAAYEVHHTTKEGTERRITFIDTPGHAAFSGMRSRGAHIADIAVLIVSAEDGVKTQTIEAIDIIKKSEVPYIVAINKIDKPNADPERVKMGLMEHGIFLEGYGGNTPYVQISAKTGIGVDDFLETILLVADLEEFSGSPDVPASGFVVESHLDQKRGTSAVLIIKNGTLKKGDYVLVHGALASTRIMENFLGESISKATFSSPIILTGFDTLPEVGAFFETYSNKKEAEARADEYNRLAQEMHEARAAITLDAHQILIPIILKTDVAGTAEAIESEIEKRATDQIVFKVIKTGVGSINESDVQLAISDPQTIILGFKCEHRQKN